jgi:transcriptional antiterminator Rof (Rho-off)
MVHYNELAPRFSSDKTWDHLKFAFVLLDQLSVLQRLADGNNPETQQRPLPDGTNLELPALRASWVLQRAWIRALHYRSLSMGAHRYGETQINHILKLSLALLEGEALRAKAGAPELRTPREFVSLIECSKTLIQTLSDVATDLRTESRPALRGAQYTPEETFAYNIEPKRLAAIYKRV